MSSRSTVRTLTWALLVAVGCSGGGGSSCSGSSGCGGCGGSGCLTAIPGGFPPAQRQVDAVSVKLSQNGFDFIDTEAAQLVSQILGGSSGSGLTFQVPCMQATSINIITGLASADVFICDLNNDGACTAADNDPTNPEREAGVCSASISLQGMQITPQTAMDGSVNVNVVVNAIVNTGQLPLNVGVSTPLGSACGLSCYAQFQSSATAPGYIAIPVTVNLSIDPTYNSLLAFNVNGLSDLTSDLNANDLSITNNTSCSLPVIGSVTCGVLDNSTVKGIVLSAAGSEITPTIQKEVDAYRCQKCDATNNNACPAGSTCDTGSGLCYISTTADTCPPNPLGLEGAVNMGSLLSSYGAPSDSTLDVSLVAGGQTAAPNPASTYVQDQGLQLGFLGGTQAATHALCAPPAAWTAVPAPPQMDFDAELSLSGPGTNLSSYDVGISLSDDFLNKSLFDAWQAGVLCLNVSGDTISLLSSSLLSTLIANLNELTHSQNVPMLVALRPTEAPTIRVGRGTEVPDGGSGTADPLITLSMTQVHIDFYAFLEEHYVRLFTLQGDLSVALSLEFDPTNSSVTPLIDGITMANPSVLNNYLDADSDQNLQSLFPTLLSLVTPELSNVLAAITLPTVEGLQLSVLGARGSIEKPDNSGYEHLALWAALQTPAPGMHRPRVHAFARVTDSFLPAHARPVNDSTQPTVTLDLSTTGAEGLPEYSYRIDGGFWHPWSTDSEPKLHDPILRLSGQHMIEIRARVQGEPETLSTEAAHVPFTVAYGVTAG